MKKPGLLDIIGGILDSMTLPGWVGPAVFWDGILVLLALALWFLRWLWGWLLLLLPLWKRDYVEYSLHSGNMSLNYIYEERWFQVSVVLDDGARKPGIYKGKQVIQGEGWFKVNECNIKILDKDLEEPTE